MRFVDSCIFFLTAPISQLSDLDYDSLLTLPCLLCLTFYTALVWPFVVILKIVGGIFS